MLRLHSCQTRREFPGCICRMMAANFFPYKHKQNPERYKPIVLSHRLDIQHYSAGRSAMCHNLMLVLEESVSPLLGRPWQWAEPWHGPLKESWRERMAVYCTPKDVQTRSNRVFHEHSILLLTFFTLRKVCGSNGANPRLMGRRQETLCTVERTPDILLLKILTAAIAQEENTIAVDALYNLSVDISKVRKLKGWVLRQSPVYVYQTAALLRDMGASGQVIARVLELYPEAILCKPEQMEAQKNLWMSVCAKQEDLVGIIEKFPASFFTSSSDHDNQKANILYFQTLHLNKRIISKLMATAPQSFSRPVTQNEGMIQMLQKTFLDLGGREDNLKIWLQKLITQNPYVLLKVPEALHSNLVFLRDRGFTSNELLQLLSKLKGFVTELNPESMKLTLSYSQEILGCTEAELRQIVLQCPALLYYSVPILTDRFKGLLTAGISIGQIMETPTVLELTTQIVHYRIEKLRFGGYNVQTGSLQVLNGTKKDFEKSYGKLHLRRERPLFNPVAPLSTED